MKHYIKVGGIFCLGLGLFTTLSSLEENAETSQISYVQSPPIAKQYWVQKIRTPEGVNGGDYSVVLRTRFVHDLPLPDVLNIYKNGEIAQVMQDNGVYPDIHEKDGIFSTIINEDPDVFTTELAQRYINLNSQGYVMQFTGHSGKIIKTHNVKPFNFDGFNQFQELELPGVFVEGTSPCDIDDNSIIKQNSLLITNLKVVEDPARTYNVVDDTGNPQGAWTFGQLIKNMAGGYADEASPTTEELTKVRDFIKTWIIEFYSNYSVNNQTSSNILAGNVKSHIIQPWIDKTKSDLGLPTPAFLIGDWENIWDSFSVDAQTNGAEVINTLLKNAPFKLSAIVNRIDLRGNSGYSGAVNNAGETRFIFSLIQTLEEQGSGGFNNISNQGQPPWHTNTGDFPSSNPITPQPNKKIDWRGMNVILEYANTQTTECGVKDLGQQWKDLSNYDLNSTNPNDMDSYLTNLQSITDLVTTRNANPSGINGSAISQIRTNSKLFLVGYYSGSANGQWEPMNWELREFGLNQSGYLVSQPTKNMPKTEYNYKRNSVFENTAYASSNASTELVNWIYGINGPSHKFAVMNGNHNLSNHLLAPTAEAKEELLSYFGLGFWHSSFPDDVYDDDNYTSYASLQEKEIRHQISLNSCVGCHTGETKTMFSMIQPLGYGQEANYWSSIPASITGSLDNGRQISNVGYTFSPNHPDAVDGFIPNHTTQYYEGITSTEPRTVPLVSPFLTGRNYRGIPEGIKAWDDDLEDEASPDESSTLFFGELNDNKITGLFYVNDPSNEGNINAPEYSPPSENISSIYDTPFPQYHNKKYGYNELENRQMDLCLLTNTSCNEESGVFDILGTIGFSPLPYHGH